MKETKNYKFMNDKKIEEKFKGKNPLDEVLEILEKYDEGTPPRQIDRCC